MEYYEVLDDDVTLTAGAADHTSNVWDAPTYVLETDNKTICIKLSNGATGPTAPAKAQIQVGYNGTDYYNYGGPIVGSTSNNAVVSTAVSIPAAFRYTRVVSGSNTGQDVTIRVEAAAAH